MDGSKSPFDIAENRLEEGAVYVIAEAGVNHNGDLDRACELVDVASESGADAVKFQTFTAERLVTADAPAAEYQTETADFDSQYELLERHELSRDDHERLQRYCKRQDITFLSTPFDRASADLLDELGVPAMKLGSGELTNHPLLRHVAEFGKPMLVSTGMATMTEVEDAVAVIRETAPGTNLALLHCTSTYPADLSTVNLRAMRHMAESFGVPVGYSDHTTHVAMPGFATAAGALLVEKHFTLDRSLPGPDHHASLEPSELSRAVSLARDAAVARGSSEKRPTPDETEMKQIVRKGLYAARELAADTTLAEADIAIKRPANGIAPTKLPSVVGRTLATSLDRDEPITEDVLR